MKNYLAKSVAALFFAVGIAIVASSNAAALMALDCSTHFATAQAAIDKVANDMNADIPWNRPEDKKLVLALLDDANSRLASAKRNHETAQGDYDHARDIAMAGAALGYAKAADIFHLQVLAK